MSVPTSLVALVGHWAGTKHVWLSPDDPARESDTTMSVALVAQGQFATLHYTWADEGTPQDGLLVLGHELASNAVQAGWIDSWHMPDKMMICQGTTAEQGVITVRGSYAAPPGPDWGWQIDIVPGSNDTFQLVMYNILPDGDSHRAVEATYRRTS